MSPRLLVLVTAGVLVAALGTTLAWRTQRAGNQVSAPSLDSGETVTSGLLLTRGDRLIVRAAPDGPEVVIKQAVYGSSYAHPRWSPDGSQIAYVITTPYGATGSTTNWGDDVSLSSLVGADERIVRQRSGPGTTVQGLAWTPDGRTLYLGVVETTFRDGQIVGQQSGIERLDIATEERAIVITGAGFPSVSADGTRIAFVTYSTTTAQPGGLWTARLDGSDRTLLVPQTGMFVALLAPRFSPDGSQLAFAAAVPRAALVPTAGKPQGRVWPWQVPRAAAHGLPMDIWMVPSAGGTPTRVTDLLEDEPVAAWSPDSRELAVIATGGLYQVPVQGGEAQRLGLGAYGAQIDWR